MNTWTSSIRSAAQVSGDDDLGLRLEAIQDWQERAREVADDKDLDAALEQCPPREGEAGAIYELYAITADTIYHVCREELERASEVQAVVLEDVLHEAYPLFQRVLVRFDGGRGGLRKYLDAALRQYVKRYIESASHETTDEDEMGEMEDREAIAPGFNLVEIFQELVDEGRVNDDAVRLWNAVRE